MPTSRHLLPLLAALIALGCQAQPPATLTTAAAASVAPSEAPTATPAAATIVTATLSGIAKAPVGFISANGAGVIPTGGGNVVPTGGGLFRLAAVTQAPLANTQVYLADAQGQAYPGIAPVTTDATGAFSFPGVPSDLTVMVVAAAYDQGRQKAVTLRTLAKAGGAVVVDAASSVVTAEVVKGSAALGGFDGQAFQAAAEATAEKLTDADLPDFGDQQALAARAEALAAEDAALKAELDQTRVELQKLKEELARLEEQLRRPVASPPPAPAPAPTQAAAQPTIQPTTQPTTQAAAQPPAGCDVRVEHKVFLRGTYPAYPVTVIVSVPNGGEAARTQIAGPGAYGTVSLPEGCAHRWEAYGPGGKLQASNPQWIIPVGAPKDLYPPQL